MENFFADDELYNVLQELNELDDVMVVKEDEEELDASERRYLEIIKKHKMK